MDRLRCLSFLLLAVLSFAAGADSSGTVAYEIDAARSNLHWRVYKGGAFSRLGHNHVVSAQSFSGFIELAADPRASIWRLEIPVSGLVVDDPTLRARYGEEFSSQPSASDISGTRDNMLGRKVLDAAAYPTIRVTGKGFEGELDRATLALRIAMLGREIEIAVPGRIVIDGEGLKAAGTFSLTHADLGMEPFSVMLGGLKVAEQLDFSYEIRAIRAD